MNFICDCSAVDTTRFNTLVSHQCKQCYQDVKVNNSCKKVLEFYHDYSLHQFYTIADPVRCYMNVM